MDLCHLDFNEFSDTSDTVKKRTYFKEEVLDLRCQWDICDSQFSEFCEFDIHMNIHESEVIQFFHEEQVLIGCLWSDCEFENESLEIIKRHMHNHTYSAKLMAHGANMLENNALPICTANLNKKNDAPGTRLDKMKCGWTKCDKKEYDWLRPQQFYLHIGQHLDDIPVCDWSGCGRTGLPSKLKEHAKTHTKEKLIGCPNCGALFANRVKFMDHCLRNQSVTGNDLPCEVCQRVYPTERLLKNHMRIHINTIKCKQCEMSCSSPSNLKTHMKYKHQAERKFKCNFCIYSAKSKPDLKDHESRHTDLVTFCKEEGCSYSFRSRTGLESHTDKVHGNNESRYACQLCDKKYRRGADLTKHLKSVHKLSCSFSRFVYKKNFSTGYFTLQTRRLESEDIITARMNNEIKGEACENDPGPPSPPRAPPSITPLSSRPTSPPGFPISMSPSIFQEELFDYKNFSIEELKYLMTLPSSGSSTLPID